MRTFATNRAEREHHDGSEKFQKEDVKKVLDEADALNQKFEKSARLKKFLDEYTALFSLLKDYFKGTYKDVPWKTIASIGATLLYVLSPIDLIPDVILGVGYIDDAAVFSICLKFVKDDLDKYLLWKKRQDPELKLLEANEGKS